MSVTKMVQRNISRIKRLTRSHVLRGNEINEIILMYQADDIVLFWSQSNRINLISNPFSQGYIQ